MSDRSMNDGDFDYDEELEASALGGAQSLVVANQPHDEEIALSDSDDALGGGSIDLESSPNTDNGEKPSKPHTPPAAHAKPSYDDLAEPSEALGGQSNTSKARNAQPQATQPLPSSQAAEAGTTRFNPAPAVPGGVLTPGGYDPSKYAHLNVEPAIKELFEYIGRYQPEKRELPTHIKLFIPEYIPTVGDVDEFLKPPRPDGAPETLGLKVLDEPAAKQSDPAILRKHLKAVTKWTAVGGDDEAAIPHGDEDREKKIDDWISNVAKLRDTEHAGEYVPHGRFPPIDSLMQAWPEELETMVRGLRSADTHVDVDVLTLAQTVCNLLDIPVYDNPIESLHCLYTLYLEMRSNPMLNPPAQSMAGMQYVNYG